MTIKQTQNIYPSTSHYYLLGFLIVLSMGYYIIPIANIYSAILSSTTKIIIMLLLISYLPPNKTTIKSFLSFGIFFEISMVLFLFFILPILETMGG